MAGQRITFGFHLDGQRPHLPENNIGYAELGPIGFLNILETQLGLISILPSNAQRIVQYRECLEKLDTEDRFYHKSFEIDPLGTAGYLLSWRDQWYLHGWNGDISVDAPQRLRDLADVEVLARTDVSINMGQRLKAVQLALKQMKPDIDLVVLADSIEIFPHCWQEVLAMLPTTYHDGFNAKGCGFLGALQQRLLSASKGKVTDRLQWQDDGSVVVVQAETKILANHWLSTQISSDFPTLLVSNIDAARLDTQFVASGLPRHGLKDVNQCRPALQVLPLVLELLWDPINFQALLQFLTHPVCPVPSYARRRLAEKIVNAPGIGGAEWDKTLAQIKTHYGVEQSILVIAQIENWIEHQRYSADSGAPLAAVIERVSRLFEFFRKRLSESDRARSLAFQSAYGQCRSCLEALEELRLQGARFIRPVQLQKLVTEVSTQSGDNPIWKAETGSALVISHPGAAIHPIERVIWTSLSMPVLPTSSAWSAAEVRALARSGANLPSISDTLDQIAASWLRPVIAAKNQLILVLPPYGEEVHPLWQMMNSVVDQMKISSLESLITSGGQAMVPVAPLPLPQRKRWWQLPRDVKVGLRPKESFSSLEKLLFNPYHWLLEYKAKLRPSRISNMIGGYRLFGSLAHKLIEQYFLQPDALNMSRSTFEVWYEGAFNDLIDQEGAVLRAPGCGADIETLRYHLFQSMLHLQAQISKANIIRVLPEHAVSGHFLGGELAGSIDLVMENKRGNFVIVDMKWAGGTRYLEKLKKNSHLQLAIYAELLRQHSGQWPQVAYYILHRASFIASNESLFPGAQVVAGENGENIAQLWLRFIETWQWRVAQIKSGQFEVAIESVPITADSVPPEQAMAMETLNEAYNDYSSLAGWEN